MKWTGHATRWVVGALAFALAAAASAAPDFGMAPPDYLGKTPDGEEVRISDRRGKVVMVSFWASWCGYCRRQFPMLDTFQTRVGRDRLEVILVNFKESARDYRAVRRDLKNSPVTWTHDADGAISDAYGVSAVPRLFVIDKHGELAYTQSGYSDDMLPELVDVVNELLAEPGPDVAAPAAQAVGAGGG
ncbi:TlpA family protein disulfide reductase [Luteimonas dalianensis]|uniref:TlpA family protein disulfide reductase n=1 Tax=Luteimonas dalianensis TaxID=1148196 RepID=UPI003BEF8951